MTGSLATAEFYAKYMLMSEPFEGASLNKIAADILKLNLAATRKGGEWRKILLFADESACRQLRGSSWLAEACRDSRIEIQVAATGDEIRQRIAAAQRKQKMVNVE